jgi:hypothetical protein
LLISLPHSVQYMIDPFPILKRIASLSELPADAVIGSSTDYPCSVSSLTST